MTNFHRAVILQGSNLGDRYRNLDQSLELILSRIGSVEKVSSFYETAPWGNMDQDDFINRVIVVQTVLNPTLLLESLLAIETVMGRTRTVKWEPRTIDLDILFYDDLVIESEELVIPHPQLQNRLFTLIPLNELIPGYMHPVLKLSISDLLIATTDHSDVRLLGVEAISKPYSRSKSNSWPKS